MYAIRSYYALNVNGIRSAARKGLYRWLAAQKADVVCLQEIKVTPGIFDVSFIHNQPNGTNINEECGSQHTKDLSESVLKLKADLGLAFDGDADRLIAVDETGQQITGDTLLAVLSGFAKQAGKLDNNVVVSTVMSNVV